MNIRKAALGIVVTLAFGSGAAWSAVGGANPGSAPPAKPTVPSPPPAVKVSTPTESEPTVNDLYPAERMRLRDPFAPGGAGGTGESLDDADDSQFSIHDLTLKGILQNKSGDFALFIDEASGRTYVLRQGVLVNSRNEPMPGISGIIKARQKTVHLITAEKDVQTFILGEEGGAP